MHHLPTKDFRWIDDDDGFEWVKTEWMDWKKDQSTGYIIDCDLSYPSELHIPHKVLTLE